jgi:hypothetical protein
MKIWNKGMINMNKEELFDIDLNEDEEINEFTMEELSNGKGDDE